MSKVMPAVGGVGSACAFNVDPSRVPVAEYPTDFYDPQFQPQIATAQAQNALAYFASLQAYCCAFVSGSNTVATTNPFPLGILAQSGSFSVASGTRLTIPTAGTYAIQYQVVGSCANATNPANIDITLRVNGSTVVSRIAGARYSTSTSFEFYTPVGIHVLVAAANDYIEIINGSGANVVTSSIYNANLLAKRIG